MAAPYNFRTAFNGFNREDVVHYIEYINSNHNNQVNQLKSDLSAARKELAALRSQPSQTEKVEELTALCQSQEAQLATMGGELEALRSQLAAVTAERDAAAAQPQVQSNTADELEAYRRAERMERQARERTEIMYRKATGVLADATARVDDATGQLGDIADQVVAQLAIFRDAVTDSKQILAEAAATLAAIRPTEE